LDLATATAQPIPLTLAGRPYLAKPRTLDELGELQAWVKRTIPSPLVRTYESIESAHRHMVNVRAETRDAALRVANEAEASWPPRVGSLTWAQALENANQVPYFIRWALLPCHPDLTTEAAHAIYQDANAGELLDLIAASVLGRAPGPKSRPGLGPATTTGTTTDEAAPESETTPTTGAP
jgi:hypothetical protein